MQCAALTNSGERCSANIIDTSHQWCKKHAKYFGPIYRRYKELESQLLITDYTSYNDAIDSTIRSWSKEDLIKEYQTAYSCYVLRSKVTNTGYCNSMRDEGHVFRIRFLHEYLLKLSQVVEESTEQEEIEVEEPIVDKLELQPKKVTKVFKVVRKTVADEQFPKEPWDVLQLSIYVYMTVGKSIYRCIERWINEQPDVDYARRLVYALQRYYYISANLLCEHCIEMKTKGRTAGLNVVSAYEYKGKRKESFRSISRREVENEFSSQNTNKFRPNMFARICEVLGIPMVSDLKWFKGVVTDRTKTRQMYDSKVKHCDNRDKNDDYSQYSPDVVYIDLGFCKYLAETKNEKGEWNVTMSNDDLGIHFANWVSRNKCYSVVKILQGYSCERNFWCYFDIDQKILASYIRQICTIKKNVGIVPISEEVFAQFPREHFFLDEYEAFISSFFRLSYFANSPVFVDANRWFAVMEGPLSSNLKAAYKNGVPYHEEVIDGKIFYCLDGALYVGEGDFSN